MKAYFTGISILFLAISVISSAFILSNSTNKESVSTVAVSTENGEESNAKQLLSKEQASDYLGISVDEFDVLDRNHVSSFGEGIPFLEINGNKYYTIQSLEEWLADTSHYLSNELSDFN
ncbi:hypothetical protein BKP35_18170 [Anaerobacillus arseniciselenatis]|uniref:Helix-turn-helix domain-containing protein n=1 Tax=Anaerobacillus arseniciselenatis TaxID=85682 RepID=A0A1S2L6G0_9BACI|nr:hypothetical protein [Anaerobacillus arseniciselenatis]OIJ07914.1 hypothetical protein BKP35_18170 [Anaerobacillus arseniciselenatis]